MEDLRIISRVARRVQAASVPVGRGFYTGKDDNIHVHRYATNLQIRDLTLAGKRGKAVPVITIILNDNYYEGDPDEWFSGVMDKLAKCDTWDEVRMLAFELERETLPNHAVVTHEQKLRAIDVPPAGTEITFKTLTGLEVRANPVDFHVMHRAMIGRVKGDPKRPGFAQDTSYWSRERKSAGVFYAYLKDNMSEIMKMNIRDLTDLWRDLGVKFDSH